MKPGKRPRLNDWYTTGKVIAGGFKNVGTQVVNSVIANAVGHAIDRVLTHTTTQTEKGYRKRERQPNSGYLAGKVRPRRNARWIRRKGRRPRRRAIVRRLNNGVSVQVEAAGTLTGDKCVYIGQTTALPDELLTLFVMSCMKNVLIEAGISINSWSQSRTGYISNLDVFCFVYKAIPLSTPTSAGANLIIGAGHVTFWDIASALFTLIKTNMGNGTLTDGNMITEFQYIANNRVVKVNLQDARFNIFVKSALKIQNRSVAADGDDEMDVNNVPVYGKLYNGTGNGFLQRTVDNIGFLNGTSVQAPVAIDGSSTTNFAEPPSPVEFTHCKRYSKIYVNPGHIKTNVITFKSSIDVNKFWIKMLHYYIPTSSYEYIDFGKFSMFGLERVIAKLSGEVSPGIKITYEIDCKLFGHIKPTPQKFTAPMRIVF